MASAPGPGAPPERVEIEPSGGTSAARRGFIQWSALTRARPGDKKNWKKRIVGRVFSWDGRLFALQSALPRNSHPSIGPGSGFPVGCREQQEHPMKKFAVAVVCAVVMVSFVVADEFTAVITKVDATGNKITYKKVMGKGQDKKVDEKATTTEVSKKVMVVKGKFDMDAMKLVDGDPVDGGLKAEALSAASDDKQVFGQLVIAEDGDDKGKVTKIRIFAFGKKKN
jgi:hypothetical protein